MTLSRSLGGVMVRQRSATRAIKDLEEGLPCGWGVDSCDPVVAAAAKLPVPSPACVLEFQSLAHVCAEELTSCLLLHPGLEEELIGAGNGQMMVDNHLNHFRFLSSYLASPNPADLVATARWALRTYIAHGFRPQYWRIMLPQSS